MLKINKDYKYPYEKQLEPKWIDLDNEPKWIDWGNLLVDDGQCNNVTLHLDDDGNIIYNDDIKIQTSSLFKSMIDDYYNDISQNNVTAV